MFMQEQRVKNVQVFPYFLGISTDVEPVISGAGGTYSTGQMMGSQFRRLVIGVALHRADQNQHALPDLPDHLAVHTNGGFGHALD